MRPSSLDEQWERLKAEYAAQKREVPAEDRRWYEQQLRHLQMRMAIAVHEGRARSDQKGAA
jgi:hypothetical protein